MAQCDSVANFDKSRQGIENYIPFADVDKWSAFLDERAESLRQIIVPGNLFESLNP